MKVIMDSDSLIKLTKARAKEIVLKNTEAYIPPKVFEEVVKIPKEEGYPDAFLIEENISSSEYPYFRIHLYPIKHSRLI